MPLLSFEGVEVDIPTSLAGIQFTFRDGTLTINCTNFSGDVVLSKSAVAAAPAAPAARSAPASATAAKAKAKAKAAAAAKKKRSLDTSSVDESAEDEDGDSESSASELLPKRVRPNFFGTVEQPAPPAQTPSASSPPDKLKTEGVDASAEKAARAKTPPPSSSKAATPAGKKAAVQMTLFSPDASKPLGARKATPDSQPQKKRSRPPKPEDAKAKAAPAADAVVVANPPVVGEWTELETHGAGPVGRWGDSATLISGNRVVLYGGADDEDLTLGGVHLFDLAKRAWSKPLNCESIPRTWHDAVYLASKHLLLVFGGERFMGGEQVDVLADIMVLDTECFLWYPPAVSGAAPAGRSGHTCTAVGDDVVVFGGTRGRNRQSSVHVLDTNAWHWRQLKVDGKAPSARTYHSAVALGGDRVVYFGGNDAARSFSSVHVLQRRGESAWSWVHPSVVGAPPAPRTGHSATLLAGGTKILVVGGWDPAGEAGAGLGVFDDAFVLDTETWEWSPAALRKAGGGDGEPLALPGRVGHRAVLDAHNNVVLFGGQDAADRRLSSVVSLSLRLDGADASSAPPAAPEP